MKLKEILEEKYLKEEDEAPAETADDSGTDDFDFDSGDENNDDAPADNATDDAGTEDNSADSDNNENTDDNDGDNETSDVEIPDDVNMGGEDNADSTKAVDPSAEIEQMVGIVDIQHSSSSTFIDFEDGGQVMFVQPITTLKVDTIKKIIELIKEDVKEAYAQQNDEVTGKKLKDTKYWKSIEVIISTMVESQLTKSDNLNGLIEEVKQLFKILDIK